MKNGVASIKVDNRVLYDGEHDSIFLKPSRNAAQNDLIQLNDANTQSELKRVWRHYRRLLDDEGNAHQEVTLDVYTYIQLPDTTIHRGSEGGMKQQAQRIVEAIRSGHVEDMGPYELQYAALTSARRARQNNGDNEGTPDIPQLRTRQQVRHIDQLVAQGKIPKEHPQLGHTVTLSLSATFNHADLMRAVGLSPDFNLNGLVDYQADELLQPGQVVNDSSSSEEDSHSRDRNPRPSSQHVSHRQQIPDPAQQQTPHHPR